MNLEQYLLSLENQDNDFFQLIEDNQEEEEEEDQE
jgi:succinate dehydrogenase flavin-adding protein (antitoxin of CptAB toxin-antitoxin module)